MMMMMMMMTVVLVYTDPPCQPTRLQGLSRTNSQKVRPLSHRGGSRRGLIGP
jgi:hypothetical protein